MTGFLFLLGGFFVFNLFWWLISARLLRKSPRWRLFNSLFLGSQSLILAWLLCARNWGWATPPPQFLAPMYLWHLLFVPVLAVLSLIVLLAGLPLLVVRLLRGQRPLTPDPESTQNRRQFLLTTAAVTPPLVNLALTGFSQWQIDQFRLRELTLAIPDLPATLSGMTIAHVSDLHVGPFTSDKLIRRIGERVNSLQSDLVLLTGDLINSRLTELPQGIDFIRSLAAKTGVYTIEGNHDLFEGRAAFESRVRAAGLQILINENAVVRVRDWPIQLLGLRWGGEGATIPASGDDLIQQSMRTLLQQRVGEGSFPILLAHHPHAFDPAAAAGIPLTLAGHTHGGQLMLNPRVGAGSAIFRYWSGLYQKNRSQLVVSNGVGNWFPLRTAAPAEVIQITLRRA